ncbi:G-box-binding factor 4 isoform X2 [Syzygium oleosum]|uniref:G-box-binding factor 4 isoform X2 n=1 Tax=Syzygium oleosum TaxID=219896 RepID=UPI0011D1AE45|nr:G-box-binding factor 4 isoform X2 [Syzygium oleosum]
MMASSKSREPDPSRPLSLSSADLLTAVDGGGGGSAMAARSASAPSSSATPSSESTLLDAPAAAAAAAPPRTVDDVWREIVAGQRRECKEEVPDEMMTLEDFLVRAGASVGVEEEEEEEEGEEVEEEEDVEVKVKVPPAERMGSMGSGAFAFDAMGPSTIETVEGSIVGFGNGVELIGVGRGKRGACVLEPLDKAAQQRQRRMIKNRESAARSRERKQAYQVELESLAVRLEEENAQLLKEKAERTKERFRQLMEKVVPIVEKPKTARVLRRVQSLQW